MSEVLSMLYMAREGEIAWNLSHLPTGTTDLPSSKSGRSNGRRLGNQLRAHMFAVLFSELFVTARPRVIAAFGRLFFALLQCVCRG